MKIRGNFIITQCSNFTDKEFIMCDFNFVFGACKHCLYLLYLRNNNNAKDTVSCFMSELMFIEAWHNETSRPGYTRSKNNPLLSYIFIINYGLTK